RLDEGVRALLPDLKGDERRQGVQSWGWGADDTIEVVRIYEGSPLFPNPSSEYLASQVFRRRGLTLNFFKIPINPLNFDVFSEQHIPDIKMRFGLHEDTEKIEVVYDLERKAIEFWGSSILSKPETWESSGKIVSMLDLPGTQLIIELEYDG